MSGKRIIQAVKTFDGALWAVQQVRELIKLGWEVHVLTPSFKGRYYDDWKKTGARLHEIPCEFPATAPWKLPALAEPLRKLILEIDADLVHSHFVSTTLALRYALKEQGPPRIFQVPGPLHLEHPLFGQWETMWAGPKDHWIASSRFIEGLYRSRYAVDPGRLFLSYYGTDMAASPAAEMTPLRERFRIPKEAVLIGNVSFIYPPKRFLGQAVGLKGHELMIDSLGALMQENEKIWAVFIGQQWGRPQGYFEKLKTRASRLSSRIIFTGYLPQKEVLDAWKEFDLALHLPSSENCGGVVEPLLNGVPVVASRIGGLPEVIIEGKTGWTVSNRRTEEVISTLRSALLDSERRRLFGIQGQRLVRSMFDVNRTAAEISLIYENILGTSSVRPDFHPHTIIGP